jgi:hypothetical protein
MSTEQDASKELLFSLLSVIKSRAKEKIDQIAANGKTKLELRSLKKDRNKMYEKLGREVERLVEAGEISHPGLIRGVERMTELGTRIEAVQKTVVIQEPEK